MRVITINELSRLTRSQLYALLVQMQAVLADLPVGSPEYQFITENAGEHPPRTGRNRAAPVMILKY